MKSILFKLMHALRRFGHSLSQALKLAWQILTRKPAVQVSFTKENNEPRTATAKITSILINSNGELYAKFTEVLDGIVQYRSFNFSRLNSITF
jgi:hypothetical protein